MVVVVVPARVAAVAAHVPVVAVAVAADVARR
jgi:hypothetical protein